MSADWFFFRVPILFIGDFLVFFGSLAAGLAIRNGEFNQALFEEHFWPFLFLFFVYEIGMYIAGFWDRRFVPTGKKTLELLVPTHIIVTVVMVLFFYFLPYLNIAPKTNLFIFSVLLFILMFFWKIASGRLLTISPIRAVLVGTGDGVEPLLTKQPLWNISIIKTVNVDIGFAEIEKVLAVEGADTVLVCVDRYPRIDVLYQLIYNDIHIIDTTVLKEEMTELVDLEKVDELWFIRNLQGGKRHVFVATKRVLDIVIALPIFVFFIVTLPFIVLAIKIDDRGSIFIVQRRVGRFGRTFDLFKYRTMSHNETRWRNRGDSKNQVTRVGEFLRKSRLDEMPQSLNILAGQMSFVGPRAILENEYRELQKENRYYRMRLLVQPGLTGWAQISQEKAPKTVAEGKERLAYDFYYIKNMSLWLELKTILKTINKLSKQQGS